MTGELDETMFQFVQRPSCILSIEEGDLGEFAEVKF
jgi:hypothetical protein